MTYLTNAKLMGKRLNSIGKETLCVLTAKVGEKEYSLLINGKSAFGIHHHATIGERIDCCGVNIGERCLMVKHISHI